MTKNIPTDKIYEDGIQLGNALFSDIADSYPLSANIDWSQDTETSPAMQDATTQLAVHSHYSNMSHLILCSQISATENVSDTLDARKYATQLSQFKMQGVDVWGRYLGRMSPSTEIFPEMQEYFNYLFENHSALTLFIGMETFGGILAYTVFTEVQELGSPLFQNILENILEQKEKEIRLTREYLEPAIRRIDDETTVYTAEKAKQCCELAVQVISQHNTPFERAGIDPSMIEQELQTTITQFYNQLGLYPQPTKTSRSRPENAV